MNGGAQILNPREAPAGDHPLTRAYVIELKYLLPDDAVQMLQGEGSRLKAFVPKGLTIDAVPKSMKLLVQTTDPQAALRLTQLISLIDQPGRLMLQPMLIILPPPDKSVGMPPPPTNTPVAPEMVQNWVQLLIDTYRGSVILYPDQVVMNKEPIVLQPVPFTTEMPVTLISGITPDQSAANQSAHTLKALVIFAAGDVKITGGNIALSGSSKVTITGAAPAGAEPFRVEASSLRSMPITMVTSQTTLISIEKETGGQHYFLALTPKLIPPNIPDLAPTNDGGFAIRGGGGAPAAP